MIVRSLTIAQCTSSPISAAIRRCFGLDGRGQAGGGALFARSWAAMNRGKATMRRQGTDEVDRGAEQVGARASARVGTWTVGFHGGLTPADRAEFAGVSVRDIALG